MTRKNNRSGPADPSPAENTEDLSPEAMRQALHELRVHQIELTMQNEELRRTQLNDITGRKEAENALRESEKTLAAMFDAITESVFLIDPQGVWVSMNKTTAARFGLKPEDMNGKLAYDFLPEYLAISRREKVEEVFRTGREVHFEDYRSGVNFKHALYPVFDQDGKVIRLVGFGQNVTDLKMAEEALRESEKNMGSMFDAITESVFLLDSQGVVLSMNQTTAQRLGTTPEDMKGKVACGFLPKDVAIPRREKIKEVLRTGREVRFEDIRNGRHFKHAIYPVFGDDGKVNRLAGFSQDIHELKMAEQALRESEEKARALLESTNDAVALFNREGIILDLNDAFARWINQKEEEITNKCIWEFFSPEVSEFRKKIFEQTLITAQPVTLIEEQNDRIFDTRVYPISDAAGTVSRVAVFIRDVTDHKRAGDELMVSHAQLRELSHYLQTAREQERIRIARGIHDELGQVLTAIKLEASWLAKKMPKGDKALKERADAISDLATGAIQSVKQIIAELRPSLLTDLGLAAAIKWQAEEYGKRTGIVYDVSIDIDEDLVLDGDISTAVFRIFQEATTNVLRHAGATKIEVSLKKTDGEIELIVHDNGIGIDMLRQAPKDAFGILGMKERALALGGKLEISGILGRGSTVAVRVPIKINKVVSD